jgi:O-antigen ligase
MRASPFQFLSALLAGAVPALLAFNLPPSATFLNQASAVIGWAVFAVLLQAVPAGREARTRPIGRGQGVAGIAGLLGFLVLVALADVVSTARSALPWSLALSYLGMIFGAAVMASCGARVMRLGRAADVFRWFAMAFVIVGALSTVVGIVQVFVPSLADGVWIARSVEPGRAVGNMRQPNHLSSLLLWAVICTAYLGQAKVLERALAAVVMAALVFGIVLTGSRTGTVGVVVLGLWGLFDKRLGRSTRMLLVATPFVYVLCWIGVTAWAHESAHVFVGDARLAQADISSSRFKIWANTLALIRMHPWFGVGYGEFNFAWTLTPFPNRPVAFFDHTHNLFLQFAVELGIPMAVLLSALLAWAMWRAFTAGRDPDAPTALALRCAFMMVLMMAIHSQLEYPLWYAYFLLPCAFAFGLCLGGRTEAAADPSTADLESRWGAIGAGLGVPGASRASSGRATGKEAAASTSIRPGGPDPDRATAAPRARAATRIADASSADAPSAAANVHAMAPPSTWRSRSLLAACLLVLAGGVAALISYLPVVAIFDPPPNAGSLESRIATGQDSWFFGHHADYAAGTTVPHPSQAMAAFDRAPHYLLDARLMMAWAKALDEAGEVDKARYVAARLKEFHNAQANEFFSVCGDEGNDDEPTATAPTAGKPIRLPSLRKTLQVELPFQCTAPTGTYTYEDFRPKR